MEPDDLLLWAKPIVYVTRRGVIFNWTNAVSDNQKADEQGQADGWWKLDEWVLWNFEEIDDGMWRLRPRAGPEVRRPWWRTSPKTWFARTLAAGARRWPEDGTG